jgi:hypothetical protein
MTTQDWLVPIAVAFLGGGGAQYAIGLWRERRTERVNRPALVDASILTVARARDELEADNARLREQLDNERAAHHQERESWMAERTAHFREREGWSREREGYQDEIDRLLVRVREERRAASERYDRLEAQLEELRRRHTDGGAAS